MKSITVTNQKELDLALESQVRMVIELRSDQLFAVRDTKDHIVRAYSAKFAAFNKSVVLAYGACSGWAMDESAVWALCDSTVNANHKSFVAAYGISRVIAHGSSTVRVFDSSKVEAFDSSKVEAFDSSIVWAFDDSCIVASQRVHTHRHLPSATVTGGTVTDHFGVIKTPQDWCDSCGVEVKDGVAILYKGLDEDFKATHKRFDYKPGTTPVAPDWDGGITECNFGLHFSPTPGHTFEFNSDAVKFVACPVALADMSVHPHPEYPNKIKARGCCAPVWEVDVFGRKIGDQSDVD